MEAIIQRGRVTISLKRHINVMLLVVVISLFSLSSAVVVATGLGGYESEKLIARDGVSDSQLFIGMSGVSDSFLDIVLGTRPGSIDPSAPVAPLINLFIPIFVITAIYALFRVGFTGELNITELFLVLIFAYMLVAVLPGLQTAVTDLFG